MHSVSAAVAVPQQSVSTVTRGKWEELDRYLILGAGDGVYYAGEPRLSVERAPALRECLAQDGVRVVNAIVAAAGSDAAPRRDPVIFALAIAASPQFADAAANAEA